MISVPKKLGLLVIMALAIGFTFATISTQIVSAKLIEGIDTSSTDTGTGTTTANTTAATGDCNTGFLGFPAWYRGLTDDKCEIRSPDSGSGLSGFIWHIALNVVEMAMMAVVYVTVFFILYGGFQFLTSQGAPEASAKARTTILNAVIGLVISLVAVGIINFIVDGLLV